MHSEVLSEDQHKLLPTLKEFTGDFGLIGGTAIALLIGHRSSIDFDLATNKNFFGTSVRDKIRHNFVIEKTLVETKTETTLLVGGVKLTFLKYPFKIEFNENFKGIFRMPDILTLASMKAFALGRRAKWKDYVDMYFIFKKFGLKEVCTNARSIFKGEFSEKNFREQLCYFDDIDYSEQVVFMKGYEVKNEEIKKFLIDVALEE